jgi:hypothetical protein
MDYNAAYLFYLTWGYWPAEYIPQYYYPLPLVEWPYWRRRFAW